MARVLLVEDNEMNRDVLVRRLKRRGYDVLSAEDGQAGIEMARVELPDLILMDMDLPIIDGWAATETLKRDPATRHIPIVALTAHAMAGDRERAFEVGCDDYATKPVDYKKLLRKMDRFLVGVDEPVPDPPPPRLKKRAPSKPVSAVEADRADLGAQGGARLLVVDDDPMNRDMLARRLRRQGYRVDLAEDGQRALAMCDAERYDLVLLDIMMPGLSGIDVLKELRGIYSPSDLPIIMATAKDESQDIVGALEEGANDYVTKPIDFPVVQARVKTQLELKRVSEELASRESSYRMLAENSADLITRTGPLGRLLYVSPAVRNLLGFEAEELCGTPADDLIHPYDLIEVLDEHARDEDVSTLIYRMRRKDGGFTWFETTRLVLRDPGSRQVREIQCTSRDISEPLDRMDPSAPPLPGAMDLVSHPGWRRGAGSTGSAPVLGDVSLSGELAPPPLLAPDAIKGTVLVINDDPTGRFLIEHTFAKEGYRVIGASSGEQGLQYALEYQPDAVLLDAALPDLDRDALCVALEKVQPGGPAPVISMSIYGYLNLDKALGPYSLYELLAALRDAVIGKG